MTDLVASEIPEQVHAILADMDCLFDMLGLSTAEKLRYMGLFMFMRIQESPRSISPSQLGKMLGALQACHERSSRPAMRKAAE